MNGTCPNRAPGDAFCDTCPLRPVSDVCLDSHLPTLGMKSAASSLASRIGLLILSCTALALIPVVFRDVVTIRGGASTHSEDLTLVITIVSAGSGLVMVVASLYGIYISLFGRLLKKVA